MFITQVILGFLFLREYRLHSCYSNELPLLSRIQVECELSHIWASFVDILRMKRSLWQLRWPAEQNGPLRLKQSTWVISLVCWASRLLLGCFWKILQLALVMNSAGLGATECQASSDTVWPEEDVTSCKGNSSRLEVFCKQRKHLLDMQITGLVMQEESCFSIRLLHMPLEGLYFWVLQNEVRFPMKVHPYRIVTDIYIN